MELFTLLAKLSLNTTEYDKAIDQAKSNASGIEIDDPELGLDDREFTGKIDDANDAKVKDPEEPDLGLDKDPFDDKVDEAENEHIEDPDEPDLGLDKDPFDETVDEAESEKIKDPEEPHLGLDPTEFNQGLEDTEVNSSVWSGHVGDIFKDLSVALTALGIAKVIKDVNNALSEGIKLAAQTGDAIDKGSKRLGISTKNYQSWDHALRQSGGSIEDLNRGMNTYRDILADAGSVTQDEAVELKKLGIVLNDVNTGRQKSRKELAEEAKAQIALINDIEEREAAEEAISSLMMDGTNLTDDQARAFRSLQLSLENSNGELKTAEQLMEESLYALAQYQGSDRDNIIDTLFGRNASSIKALIADGLDPMIALLNEAEDFGLIMSDEEVQNAVAFGDAVSNLQSEVDAIKTAFVADIIPMLTDAVEMTTKVLAFFNPRLQKDSEKAFSDEIVSIEETSIAAQTLIDKLFSMGDATKLTAEEQEEWKKTAEWLKENIPSLSEVIETDTLTITANKQQVHDLIEEWKKYAVERAKQAVLQDKENAIAEKTRQMVDAQVEANIAAAEAAGKQATALQNLNKVLNAQGFDEVGSLEEYNQWRASHYTGVLTQNQIGQAREQSEAIGNDYYTAQQNAENLQEKAESLKQEVQDAQVELQLYADALTEVFNGEKVSTEEATGAVVALENELNNLPSEKTVTVTVNGMGYPRAIGSRYIPYDNYPALLHRGEEVVTATQARRNNKNSDVDIAQLASAMQEAVLRGMESANVNTFVTDREVARGANQVNGREIVAGRYRP